MSNEVAKLLGEFNEECEIQSGRKNKHGHRREIYKRSEKRLQEELQDQVMLTEDAEHLRQPPGDFKFSDISDTLVLPSV